MAAGASSEQKPPAMIKWLVLGLVAAAPLAIGTVHPLSRGVIFGATAVLLAATLFYRIRNGSRLRAPLPLVVLLVAVGATLLQLVPLPAAVLAVVSPQADETFRMALDSYSWRPITLDIGGTLGELAKLSAYAAFFFAALSFASRGHRRRNLVLTVIVVADLVAVIGLVQAALGVREILGFYTTNAPAPSGFLVRGTFVNPNHFGALVGLAAPCALVLGMREPNLRAFAFGSLVLLNLCIVFSLSRSTILSAPLAQLLAFYLERRSWRGHARGGGSGRLFMVIAAGLALAVGAIVVADELLPELRRTQEAELDSPLGQRSKLRLWKDGAALAATYPWVGHGRGAFEQAFTQVYDGAGILRATYLENGYIQAVSDWGVPVALLLFLLLARSFAQALRNLDQDPLASGALAALVGLALHDTVDFSIDIPGVAFPALALAAVLFARPSASSEHGERVPSVPAKPWHALAVLLPVAALVASYLLPIASIDARELTRIARDPSVPKARVVAEGLRLTAAHPADYFVPALVARRLVEERDPQALGWLNRSMFLNPRFAAPHLMAAEVLASVGRKQQALIEYRLAAAGLRDLDAYWVRIAELYPAVDDLLAACPMDVRGLSSLGAFLANKHRHLDSEKVLLQALTLAPENLGLRVALVQRALDSKRPTVALERARALNSRDRSPSSRTLLVRAMIADGKLEEAARELADTHERSQAVFRLQIAVGQAMVARGDLAAARKYLDTLTWQLEPGDRALLHETRAHLEQRAGNRNQAAWENKQAAQLRAKRQGHTP